MVNGDAARVLFERLREAVGGEHVLTEQDLLTTYETDWTRRFSGRALAAVRPGSTREVAAVLSACHENGIAVVPQGGNTGLVGGSVPRGGEIVLSLRRLRQVEAFDPAAREITVGAGVTAGEVNALAAAHGLQLGVDLASRDSATVGGMAATNAGGIHVVRHGMMRSQVIGLEAVLADGGILDRMFGVVRDNTGYDLANLLIGSEGTLAVITRVRLRLVPVERRRAVALLAFRSVEDAIAIAMRARGGLASLNAAEIFFGPGMELVCSAAGLTSPFGADFPVYLLLEAAGEGEVAEGLAAFLGGAEAIAESAFATDPRDCARLWAYRERHTEAISSAGVPHKLDIALPPGRMAEFVREVGPAVQALAPEAREVLFGHVADGNLHVNLLGFEPEDERPDDAVLRMVARLGGSISAEHGVGVAKRGWVHLTRSPADIGAMAAIKRGLDPRGILNPGVIFPA
jgi:FAD/FMN-containing dehydrogenase